MPIHMLMVGPRHFRAIRRSSEAPVWAAVIRTEHAEIEELRGISRGLQDSRIYSIEAWLASNPVDANTERLLRL